MQQENLCFTDQNLDCVISSQGSTYSTYVFVRHIIFRGTCDQSDTTTSYMDIIRNSCRFLFVNMLADQIVTCAY